MFFNALYYVTKGVRIFFLSYEGQIRIIIFLRSNMNLLIRNYDFVEHMVRAMNHIIDFFMLLLFKKKKHVNEKTYLCELIHQVLFMHRYIPHRPKLF